MHFLIIAVVVWIVSEYWQIKLGPYVRAQISRWWKGSR